MSFTVALAGGGKALGKAVVLFVLLLASVGLARAESRPVIFQSTDTPPFWSPSLPENGFGGAILHLVSAAADIQYSIEYLPVKRFRQSLATYMVGDPDLLVNQKRRAIFPLGIFRSAFFYYKPHRDAIEVHHIKDLQGLTLGVLRGTLEDKKYFVANGINVEESDSAESLLKKLKRGRLDVCILVADTGLYTIGQIFPGEKDNFVQITIPGSARPIAIMIDVDVPEGKAIARHYRQVLGKTLRSQEYHDILENFYGKDNVPGDVFEQLKKFELYYTNDWDN